MRKTKSEGKTVGISQSVRKVANFAKDFDIFVRQMNSAIVVFEFRNANFALPNSQCQIRNAKWLPTVCQNSCFAFSLMIFNICSKICTKLLKLKQEKLHKGTN